MGTVFLIDDDMESSEVVAQFLERAGHTVSQSAGGNQALSSMPVVLPDVIILDLRMRQMDGFTFLRELRHDRLTAGIPAILLTGASDPDLHWRAAQFGIERVFLKGNYSLDELLACVQALVATGDAPPTLLQHVICGEFGGAAPAN